MARRAAAIATAGLAAALATSRAAPAAADDLPPGFIGTVVGVRQGTGAVAPQEGLGFLWGLAAGWQPMAPNRSVGFSLRWRTLFSGYGAGDTSNLAGQLRVIEMDLGVGMRIAPRRGEGRFVDVGAGGSLLRANVPLAPDGRRDYTGPFVSFGLEQFIGSSLSVTFEIRVGQIVTGPDTLSALVGVNLGV